MWKEFQTQLIAAYRDIHFTTFQIFFLIIISAIVAGLAVMWIKPFLNRLYAGINDTTISCTGIIKQVTISEAARPGVNKTRDKKAHVYPYRLSLQLDADGVDIPAYPYGKNKMFEYLPDAITYAGNITKNVPLKIEFRTAGYIDTAKDRDAIYSLRQESPRQSTINVTYLKKHPWYNSLTKERISWAGVVVTSLISGFLIFGIFSAANFSLPHKIACLISILVLAILASYGYQRLNCMSEEYALRTKPIRLTIDVDQTYNPDEAFKKIVEFVKTQPTE